MSEAVNDRVPFADVLKKAAHLGGTLLAVTAVTGLILGFVQHYTAIAIRATEIAARNEALKNVMPAAQTFDDYDVKPDDFIAAIWKANDNSGLVGCSHWNANAGVKFIYLFAQDFAFL